MSTKPRPGSPDDSTVQRPRIELPPRAPTSFVLDVTEGPDRGARFVLDEAAPGPLLLGQSPACALRLTDREVSRRHAAFEVDAARLRVSDLRSTNGTQVDGTAIVEAFVRSGQTIRVGATSLRVGRAESDAAPPPSVRAGDGFGQLVGASFEMRRLYPLFERLALSPLPLVIEGETGTGKELLAEQIHGAGPRAHGPLVVFDCTTVPGAQLEIELFGHEAGGVPGTTEARTGVFEAASGGTLLLDEIAELDVLLQPKLLRAIERQEITPVGSRRSRPIDVRIIAATQADLDHAIQVGRFREDLYHRLVVTRVALPPLRKRHGDIEHLARHFQAELGDASALPPLLLSRWLDHAWPGNVRELKNAVARHVAFGDAGASASLGMPAAPGSEAASVDGHARLGDLVRAAVAADTPLAPARQEAMRLYERLYVEQLLAKHGGSIVRTAAAAGVDRRYLQILRARQKGAK